MKYMKILNYGDFLNESKKNTKKEYSYGCAMLYFDFPNISDIHDLIEKDDIYSENGFGLETEPHCTLLYGLHDKEIEDDEVLDSLLNINYNEITLHNVSLFENDYDVLKFDVKQKTNKDEKYDKKDDCLYKANKILTKNYPYTTDYPDYHPHSTIVYLKKGKGKKYVELLKDKEFVITPKTIVYSKSDGTKIRRKLKKNATLISAFPGCGKSYLFKKSKELDMKILDSDSSKFDKKDFPNNYIEHIKKNLRKADIICISSHEEVRDALIENDLEFILTYPKKSLKKEFLKRYKDRGNEESFIELLDKNWSKWIDDLNDLDYDNCTKKRLGKGEFLSDVIDIDKLKG